MRYLVLPVMTLIASGATPQKVAPLSGLAEAYVASGKAEGISAAIVQCGRTRLVHAGAAAPNKPVGPGTVFEIGSLSKLFTNHLLARAIVQGRASMQDDVRLYLPPGFGNLQWRDGTPIRLVHLADTTSGLPDYLPDPAPLAKLPNDQVIPVAARLLAGYSDEEFLHDLQRIQLIQRPGTVAQHSNVAAQLLGLILSRLYHRPYASLLRQDMEAPLHMGSGTTMPPSHVAAVGHNGDGKPTPAFTGPSVTPAGGLRYSARDMARFVGYELSSDPAVRLSHARRAASADGDVAWTWLISSSRPGVKRYRLTGSTFGFSSYVEVYPALGYGVAILANRAGGDVQNELMAMAETGFHSTSTQPCPRPVRLG